MQISLQFPSNYTYLTYLTCLPPLPGRLPDSIWSFGALTHAQLADNAISGPLPDSIKSWKQIRLLHLSRNKLTGPIPGAVLKFLDKTEQLWLDGNAFTGQLPPEIGAMPLVLLRASDNRLTGSLPSAMQRLTRLEELLLHNNDLSGKVDAEDVLTKMQALRNISLAANRSACRALPPCDLCGH